VKELFEANEAVVPTVKFDGTADISERRKISDMYSAGVVHRTAEWTAGDWSVMIQDLHNVFT